jgi:hypothetical protein
MALRDSLSYLTVFTALYMHMKQEDFDHLTSLIPERAEVVIIGGGGFV